MADYKTKHAPIDDYPFVTYAPENDAHVGAAGAAITVADGTFIANFTFNDVVKQIEKGVGFPVTTVSDGSKLWITFLSATIGDGAYSVYGMLADSSFILSAESPDVPLTASL